MFVCVCVELCAKGGVSSIEKSSQKREQTEQLEVVLVVDAYQCCVSSHTGMKAISVFCQTA